MSTKTLTTLALTLLAAASLACGAGKNRRATFEHGGLERTYIYHEPEDLAPGAPLLVALHGGGGTAHNARRYYGFDELAAREGFAVVYPDGVENHWNEGRDTSELETQVMGTDDVGFLSALIEHLVAEHDLDPARVYMTGASNGAMMTIRMVCERADLLAGAAPVIGGIPANIEPGCDPSRPVPLIIFKGTADPLVPYEGGQVAKDRGEVVSTEEELAHWRQVNGCEATPTRTERFDATEGDDIETRLDVYATGCERAPVHMYTTEGGGHTWPGNLTQYAPRFIIGEPHADVDATTLIWDFFSRHPRQDTP